MSLPQRLQGTDGIRGRTSAALAELGPLETYLHKGLLTPPFFELYAYAFAQLLIEKNLAKPGDAVAVGWDGRDKEGVFDSAFMSGLRKAGLEVWAVGVLPTPAVPMFMLAHRLKGAAVLTASHNPDDQNGIKLFLPTLGLKLLPADDVELTQKIYGLRERNLSGLPYLGELKGQHDQAWKFFVEVLLRPANSWLEGVDLSDTILVLDASNGAAAAVIEPIFGNLGLRDLLLTNLEGPINHASGVGDIEGNESFSAEDLKDRFEGYDFLEEFFEVAKRLEVKNGEARLVGLAFDGDADRCYRLDYDRAQKTAVVSSGDLLGFQLARFMAKSQGAAQRRFAFTVESDLLLGQAAEGLGFSPQLTGVGDKWLLRQASASVLRSQLKSDAASSEMAASLEAWLKDPEASALEMTAKAQLFFASQGRNERGELDFALGLEESGHALSACWIEDDDSMFWPAFAGNGLKAGLNSLAAMAGLSAEEIAHPFKAGLKATEYVYYVDKSRLEPGHAFREAFLEDLKTILPQMLGPEFSGEVETFAEESSLVFCHVLKEGSPWGAVFLRNSGTEDKSALYLRGPEDGAEPLGRLADLLHAKLLSGLKDETKDMARLERALLLAINQNQDPAQAAKGFAGLPFERVLKEMERKQGLICRQAGRFEIDRKGRALL